MADVKPSIRWRKASEVQKRALSDAGEPGGSMVDKAEKVVDGAKQSIVRNYQAVQSYIGKRPFGTKQIGERQQVRRYVAYVREDPQAWTQLIQAHGIKATIDYAQRLERLMEKYPDEAAYLQPEPHTEGELQGTSTRKVPGGKTR